MIRKSTLMLTAVAAFAAAPACAELRHELDAKVQSRHQKTFNGAPSAIPTEYGDIPNGLILERYKLDFEQERYSMDAEISNLGLNNQSVRAEGGNPGKLTWKGGFDRMPHLFSNEARTLYVDQGGGFMTLPDTLQSFHQTNSATFNADIRKSLESAHYARLGFDVETGNLDLRFRPGKDVTVEFGGWRQTRRGTKPQPAPFAFSNAIELAAPVDWQTHEAYLDMQLARKEYQLGLNYRLSQFDNQVPSLHWDNPKRLTDRAASASGYSTGDQSKDGELANAPSNRAHAFKVEGGMGLPMHSRASFEGGYQMWTAFNPMLPYTTNTCLRPGCVTAGSVPPFDASSMASRPDPNVASNIEVFTYLGKLSTRPFKRLRAALTHDAYIMENKNTQYDMPGWAIFDQIWHVEQVRTPREQFRDDKTRLAFDYDVAPWLSGELGMTRVYKKQTREIPKLNEYEWSTGLVVRPSRDLFVNLSYLHAQRRGNGMDFSHYLRTTSAATGRQYYTDAPGLRRVDIADRNRNQARVQTQWALGELAASLSARLTRDAYRQGKGSLDGGDPLVHPELMGLVSDFTQAYGVDVSVPVAFGITADAYYEHDFSRRHLRASQTACSGSTAGASVGLGLPGEPACGAGTLAPTVMTQDPRTRWETLMRDNSQIAGVALTWLPLAKLKTVIGYDVVSTRQDGNPISAGGYASTLTDPYLPFPTSRRMQQTSRVRAEYRLTEALTLAGNYGYEKFDATDFAYGSVPLRDLSNASIFLGANPIRNYYAHTASFGMNYKF